MTRELVARLVAKAEQSTCKFRVAAVGLNSNGDVVAVAVNRPGLPVRGGGVHAEQGVFRVARRRGVVKIVICRIGRGGAFRPIDPCEKCRGIAEKMGVKIESIGG